MAKGMLAASGRSSTKSITPTTTSTTTTTTGTTMKTQRSFMLANYLSDSGQSVGFFNSIDLDQSGEIDTYEFQTFVADIADLPPWDMQQLMKAVDMDGNGRINVPELN